EAIAHWPRFVSGMKGITIAAVAGGTIHRFPAVPIAERWNAIRTTHGVSRGLADRLWQTVGVGHLRVKPEPARGRVGAVGGPPASRRPGVAMTVAAPEEVRVRATGFQFSVSGQNLLTQRLSTWANLTNREAGSAGLMAQDAMGTSRYGLADFVIDRMLALASEV